MLGCDWCKVQCHYECSFGPSSLPGTRRSFRPEGSPSRLPFPLVFGLILNQISPTLSLGSHSQSLCFEGASEALLPRDQKFSADRAPSPAFGAPRSRLAFG